MAKKKDNNIEKEYWEEVEFLDKVTGRMIRQKVKIVKYKTILDSKQTRSILEEIEEEVIENQTGEED